MIENGPPNGINKSSKLKPWASKVAFLKILMDFGKLVFLMFLGAGKRQAEKTKLSRFLEKRQAAVDSRGCES